jgi:hypothetical protein
VKEEHKTSQQEEEKHERPFKGGIRLTRRKGSCSF